MEFIKIALLILVTVVIVSCIPTFSKEISLLITISCCIVVLLYIVNTAFPAVEYIKDIAKRLSFYGIEVVIKSIGVGFITQFVADIAVDSGNKSLSNQIIFAGRICVIILTMPIFYQIFEIVDRLTS